MRRHVAAGLPGIMTTVLLAAGCAGTPARPEPAAAEPHPASSDVRQIPFAQAAEGDLVFFRDQEKLSHVGIYLGDGRFVHAPSSGDTVRVASIDAPYYQRHLVAVGRLLP